MKLQVLDAAPAESLATILSRLPVVAAAIGEGAAERERARELPYEQIRQLKSSGLAKLRIPLSRGGPGGSVEDLVGAVSTLARADSNVAHALRIHFNMTEILALSARSEPLGRQTDRVLTGALFGGASTEAGTAKPGMYTTELRRDGARFRLNGRKYYATGSAFSDYVAINVLDPDGERVVVVLPVDRAGLSLLDDWDGMGQRLTASGSIVLDDVLVEAEEVVPRDYTSLVGRHASALRQLYLVAVAAGIVRNIEADAIQYVRHRGRPAAHSPADTAREDVFNQQVVGELAAIAHVLDALILQNARTLDAGAVAIAAQAPDAEDLVLASTLATAKTQVVAARLAMRAGEQIFEAGGASATSRALNFDRHWRNLRTIFSHNPLLHKARVIGDFHLNGTRTHLEEGSFF